MPSIFDGLEKLITEHGSAAILRERVALARERYDALEAEYSQLKAEHAALATELKKEREAANRLRNLASKGREQLNEDQEKILVHLSKVHGYTVAGRVSQHTGISMLKTEYHLKELRDEKYLDTPMVIRSDEPRNYKLGHRGREYLINHGLVE